MSKYEEYLANAAPNASEWREYLRTILRSDLAPNGGFVVADGRCSCAAIGNQSVDKPR